MAGKYTPLEHYLHNLPIHQKEITLSFEQVERILNDKLPLPRINIRSGGITKNIRAVLKNKPLQTLDGK